jgi:hypothetical protein
MKEEELKLKYQEYSQRKFDEANLKIEKMFGERGMSFLEIADELFNCYYLYLVLAGQLYRTKNDLQIINDANSEILSEIFRHFSKFIRIQNEEQ